MTIRNLEIFLEVAKSGSMSYAAKSLYISQPTVSHAISSLEHEYSTQLFDRSPHRLYLTQTGKLLVEEAQNVLQAIDHLQESMQAMEANAPIHLGASVTVAVSVLDNLIDQFHKIHPQVQIKTLISNTFEIETALQNNEIDLAIVSGEIHNPLLETQRIIPDYQACVCRSDHPLAGRDSVTLEELSREKFIILLRNRWTRMAFEDLIHDAGYSLNVACECSNTGLVKERVLKDGGVTVISIRAVKKELLSGQFSVIRCDGCLWQRPFMLAHRKQKYLSRSLTDLIAISKDFTDDIEEMISWTSPSGPTPDTHASSS